MISSFYLSQEQGTLGLTESNCLAPVLSTRSVTHELGNYFAVTLAVTIPHHTCAFHRDGGMPPRKLRVTISQLSFLSSLYSFPSLLCASSTPHFTPSTRFPTLTSTPAISAVLNRTHIMRMTMYFSLRGSHWKVTMSAVANGEIYDENLNLYVHKL